MSENAHSQFLGYLHSFRGIAIIQIVLIHAIVAAFLGANSFNYDITHPLAIANEVLFHDSTLYFAIISGLLYTAILKPRGYGKFYRSKFRNVFLPYLFFTLIFTIYTNSLEDWNEIQPTFLAYLSDLPVNFLYGKAVFVFWYIPVLFFMYLVTPLLDYLMNSGRLGKVILFLFILSPLVVSRVETIFASILSLESMIYFSGAYAIGMYIGEDLNGKLDWLRTQIWTLSIIAVLSSVVLIYLYVGDIKLIGFIDVRETAYYIQKIAMGVIFILWLRDVGERAPKWLNTVAESAFTIYFIHSFFLFNAIAIYMPLLTIKSIAPINTLLGGLVMLLVSISASILIVKLVKKLIGKNSRMLIGA